MAGGVDRLDPQVARLEDVAVVDRAGDGVADELAALRVREHGHAEALRQLLDADHVVVVVVGEQDVGDRRPLALDPLDERVGDVVGVDQHPGAAGLVDDEVGVGEEICVLDALENHASNSMTDRIPSWASISSKPWLTSSSVIRWEMNGSTSISPCM